MHPGCERGSTLSLDGTSMARIPNRALSLQVVAVMVLKLLTTTFIFGVVQLGASDYNNCHGSKTRRRGHGGSSHLGAWHWQRPTTYNVWRPGRSWDLRTNYASSVLH
ncbi:hypothetical protein BS78_06G097200 [Paspalum vaginatum]|nr:hypothetical protein BS78_06G097200 [Paspalum vaginatum]